MAEGKATTIRFATPIYERLEEAGEVTGLPINSIVVVACLEWLDAHQPLPSGPAGLVAGSIPSPLAPMPRPWKLPGWRRGTYPFDRFTERAKHAFVLAQEEAVRAGQEYIGDDHLLLALAADPNSSSNRALLAAGLDLERLRAAVQSEPPGLGSGLLSTLGIPTSNMKRIVEAAFKHARREGDRSVGTLHLLTALVSEPDTRAAALLARLGIDAGRVTSEAERTKRDNPHLG